MNTLKTCQDCGAPLAPDAPQGLCPACLMKVALATGTEPGGKSPRFIPPTVAELASHFPQLEILEFIGQGGMGAVYKARQKELDRIVALKILPPDIGHDAAFAERFTREAKALARLNHPGIVTIYDSGRADGLYFFLMEYVDGVNLRQLLATSRVSAREALAIVPQICDALQFAHDQGIVHRDIKPENLLLDRRGRIKVADFGLAKIIEGRAGSPLPVTGDLPTDAGAQGTACPGRELTDASKIMGTPQYMSPEQVRTPGEVDHRADIYALGVVFYQMLTGELPGTKLEAPSKKVQIDVRLDEVVLRALEKNPDRRYQQVSEVKTLVETIVATPRDHKCVRPAPETSGAPGNPVVFRSSQSYISSPQHLRTFVGRWLYIYEGKGTLRLTASHLEFLEPGLPVLRIPLRSIQDLQIGQYSRLAKPGGLNYITIGYEEAGQIHTRYFTPATSPLAPYWATNQFVTDWFDAIRTSMANAREASTVTSHAAASSEPDTEIESGKRTTPMTAEGTSRVSFAHILGAIWVLIIASTVALLLIKSHSAGASTVLSQSEFLDKFRAHEIAHATIQTGGQNSNLTPVTGTYFKTDSHGKVTREEVSFTVPNAFLTPKVLDELLASGQVSARTPNRNLANTFWGLAPFIILGVGLFLIPGAVIYFIWRAMKQRRASQGERRGSSTTPATMPGPPRFSRIAMAGIGLGLVAVVMFGLAAILRQVAVRLPTGENPPNSPVELLSLVLVLAGLMGALAMTLLGWLAVSHIGRSEGKLCGMWLAVFDGLLFPLLAINSTFYYFLFPWLRMVINELNRRNPTASIGLEVDLVRAFFFLAFIAVCLWLDWFIIRRVWQKVNPDRTTGSSGALARKNSAGISLAWACGFLGLALGLPLVIGLLLASKPALKSNYGIYFGNKATLRARAPQSAHPQPNRVRQLAGCPFLAQLPEGGSIELLAVRIHPSTNQPWWQPDGSPSTYDSSVEAEAKEQIGGGLLALARFHYPSKPRQNWPLPAGAKNLAAIDVGTGPRFALKDGRRLALSEADPYTLFGVVSFEQALPRANEITLAFKVATADWQTLTVKKPGVWASLFASAARQEWQFGETPEGNLKVTVTHLAESADMQYRLVAVDVTGVEYVPSTTQCTKRANEIASTFTASFSPSPGSGERWQLPLGRVREVRWESRPYEPVEFRNVSLQPGYRTKVTVKDFGGEQPSAALANTNRSPTLLPGGASLSKRTYSSFSQPADFPDESAMPAGTFNLKGAQLEQVLSLYEMLSGRSAIRGALPKVQINLRSLRAMSRSETLQMFDTALAQNGIAMVLSGYNAVKAVPADQAAGENPPEIDLPWELLPDSSSPMSRIIPLKNLRAAEVAPRLKPLAKLPNSMVVVADRNLLILRDYASSIRQELKLVETWEGEQIAPPGKSSGGTTTNRPTAKAEPTDLRAARSKLAELRVNYAESNPVIQRVQARIQELARLTKEEPDMPTDLREAKAHLAELHVDYSPQNPAVQRTLARIQELARLTKEEPNMSADLREAKARLAELRVDYSEQSQVFIEALAKVKALAPSRQ